MSNMTISGKPAENKMGVMPISRLLFTMSLPMILSMLVQALYNVIDSIFVARLGETALAAVSLAFPVQNLFSGSDLQSGDHPAGYHLLIDLLHLFLWYLFRDCAGTDHAVHRAHDL